MKKRLALIVLIAAPLSCANAGGFGNGLGGFMSGYNSGSAGVPAPYYQSPPVYSGGDYGGGGSSWSYPNAYGGYTTQYYSNAPPGNPCVFALPSNTLSGGC